MSQLTPKERMIYEFIAETIRSEGYPPSVRDIQESLAIKSTSTVHSYLEKLEAKGYVTRSTGKSRSIRVNDDTTEKQKTARVPVIGTVAAGLPILAEENVESHIEFPLYKRSYNASSLFALKVKGDSMIDAGIFSGDFVVVERSSVASNGNIVVALVNEDDGPSATVKTFYKENNHYRLQPENKDMEPIIVTDVTILGKVISVLRFY